MLHCVDLFVGFALAHLDHPAEAARAELSEKLELVHNGRIVILFIKDILKEKYLLCKFNSN